MYVPVGQVLIHFLRIVSINSPELQLVTHLFPYKFCNSIVGQATIQVVPSEEIKY